MKTEISPIACDLNALPPVERQRHMIVTRRLLSADHDFSELADGLELRFPPRLDGDETEPLRLLAEWVARERLCCPFLQFDLRIEPRSGPLSLRLTGPPGTKEILQAALGPATG